MYLRPFLHIQPGRMEAVSARQFDFLENQLQQICMNSVEFIDRSDETNT